MAVTAPKETYARFRILDVETDTQTAHAEDKTGGLVKLKFGENYGILIVPVVGEIWTAQRTSWYWKLISRVDSLGTTLEQGDALINIDGTLNLDVGEISINNQPLGTTTRDMFYPDGTYATFTLTSVPVHIQTLQVFVNGLLLDPNFYSLSGQVLTLGFNAPAGGLTVYYQRIVGLHFTDEGIVTGKAVIGVGLVDAAVVTGIAKVFQTHDDSGTVTGTAIASSTNIFTGIDAGTVTGVAVISTILDASNQEQSFLFDANQGWISFQINVP